MWDLWWTKWHWERFFSEFFCFPLSIPFHRRSPYSYIIRVMNNMSVSGSSSETLSHLIEIYNIPSFRFNFAVLDRKVCTYLASLQSEHHSTTVHPRTWSSTLSVLVTIYLAWSHAEFNYLKRSVKGACADTSAMEITCYRWNMLTDNGRFRYITCINVTEKLYSWLQFIHGRSKCALWHITYGHVAGCLFLGGGVDRNFVSGQFSLVSS
jgi:hypothetical protein